MTENEPAFKLFWNRRKQWVAVYLWDVHPDTFESWDAGRWAYYLANSYRCKTTGLFGDLHFVASRVRADVVAHELIHLLCDYLRNKDTAINVYNEERIAGLFDSWTRQFWKAYKKIK